MSHPHTDRLVGQIEKMLAEAGVESYLFFIKCPDSDYDIMRSSGSIWWRLGAAHQGVRRMEQEVDNPDEQTTEEAP